MPQGVTTSTVAQVPFILRGKEVNKSGGTKNVLIQYNIGEAVNLHCVPRELFQLSKKIHFLCLLGQLQVKP